jgi:intracellular multiplication protein IcmB
MIAWKALLSPLTTAIHDVVNAPLGSFVRLETAENRTTMVHRDGTLTSVLAVDGAREIVADAEFADFVERAEQRLSGAFQDVGYALQVHYTCDPGDGVRAVRRHRRGAREAAAAIGLDFGDLFESEAAHLGSSVVKDRLHWVVSTRPEALVASERKRAVKKKTEKRKADQVKAPVGEAQNLYAGLEPLRALHVSFADGLAQSLRDLRMAIRPLNAHASLAAIKDDLYPYLETEGERFCLPDGSAPPMRLPERLDDFASVLEPPLAEQLCVDGASLRDIDGTPLPPGIVRIGRRLWGGVDVVRGPQGEAPPFDVLAARLRRNKVPFRISVFIESGGARALGGFRTFVTDIAGALDANRPKAGALRWLRRISGSQAVVVMRISLATWAPVGERERIQDQVQHLVQALKSWNSVEARTDCGDPLEGVVSSALGLHCASTAEPAVLPIRDALAMLPMQIQASPYASGGVLLRSADGRPYPFQLISDKQNAAFLLVYAGQGSGKSVLLSTVALGTVLDAGASRLPYIVHLDFGDSGQGYPGLLHGALPPGRQHEAQHYRIKNSELNAINPFDTDLGARCPTEVQKRSMIDFLETVWTPAGRLKPFPGTTEIADIAVTEMFRRKDDGEVQSASPRVYGAGADNVVDEALERLRITLGPRALWWQVVDALFKAGDIRAAERANRHAAPLLADAIEVLQSPECLGLWGGRAVEGGTELLVDALKAQTQSALDSFKVLTRPTRWEPGARVCVVDLQDVAGGKTANGIRQTSVMYALCLQTLTRHWWADPDDVGHLPPMYRDRQRAIAEETKATRKLLLADEVHHINGVEGPLKRIEDMVRVGRKYAIAVVLVSQRAADFNETLNALATARFMLSGGLGDEIETMTKRFGLSSSAQAIVRSGLTGPRRGEGGPLLAIIDAREQRYVHHVFNLLGPHMLWAFSTKPDDTLVRRHVYRATGMQAGMSALADLYPDGSAADDLQKEIERRVIEGRGRASKDDVVMDVVARVVERAREIKMGRAA